jgi:hypothetical protein
LETPMAADDTPITADNTSRVFVPISGDASSFTKYHRIIGGHRRAVTGGHRCFPLGPAVAAK